VAAVPDVPSRGSAAPAASGGGASGMIPPGAGRMSSGVGWFSEGYVKEAFRPHPEVPGAWLYKEDWPLGGVWHVGGESRIESAGWLLTTHPIDAAAAVSHWPPVGYVLLVVLRRNWLKKHARRVPEDLWRRATRLRDIVWSRID